MIRIYVTVTCRFFYVTPIRYCDYFIIIFSFLYTYYFLELETTLFFYLLNFLKLLPISNSSLNYLPYIRKKSDSNIKFKTSDKWNNRSVLVQPLPLLVKSWVFLLQCYPVAFQTCCTAVLLGLLFIIILWMLLFLS